ILPHERVAEGPFGEFTGYSLGERQREVVKVRAITHRRDAIFQDITVGHLDHLMLSTTPIEANLYRAVRAMVPTVKAVRVPAPFTVYVSIEQRISGQAKNAILAVLGNDLYMKRVIVVDQDVDIFNDRQVNWAVATRCQPDRDIVVITNTRGSDLDPSTKEDGNTAKWGVDVPLPNRRLPATRRAIAFRKKSGNASTSRILSASNFERCLLEIRGLQGLLRSRARRLHRGGAEGAECRGRPACRPSGRVDT
ncbi:MAG: UbiD family decarboxylase, partial [Deltaproteobacteria bacterium]|nr:UbiD family decarboxylase [Deltaproteobacteria bacterium]